MVRSSTGLILYVHFFLEIRVTQNLKRTLILAVCCTVITVIPAAADTLANYFGTGVSSGLGGQTLTYTGNGSIFTDGNLEFQFTGLTITPTCWDGATQVTCATGSYHPVADSALNIQGTLAMNGYAGFDTTGQMSVSSYMASNGDQIDVQEDINLNYTVSTMNQAPTITDAHLDLGGCVKDLAVQSTCLTNGTGLPPNLDVNESWATPAGGTLPQVLNVSAPPPILNAYVNFLPDNTYSTLQATKDIFMETGACAGCSVSFSDLKQYYSQVVPEPRTYAWMLAFGMFGLVQLRRRITATV